ncbi:hypothetical protein VTI74DRAFT_10349 [Chaetomium olivicolor]
MRSQPSNKRGTALSALVTRCKTPSQLPIAPQACCVMLLPSHHWLEEQQPSNTPDRQQPPRHPISTPPSLPRTAWNIRPDPHPSAALLSPCTTQSTLAVASLVAVVGPSQIDSLPRSAIWLGGGMSGVIKGGCRRAAVSERGLWKGYINFLILGK